MVEHLCSGDWTLVLSTSITVASGRRDEHDKVEIESDMTGMLRRQELTSYEYHLKGLHPGSEMCLGFRFGQTTRFIPHHLGWHQAPC